MYYHTPNVSVYVKKILKLRKWILFFFAALSILAFTFLRPELISSDTLYWLSESKEFQKTQSNDYDTAYVGCLSVDVPAFDEQAKATLTSLQTEFEHHKKIDKVESLFSSYRIYKDGGEESALVKALPISQLDAKNLKSFVTSFREPYKRFVNDDFTRFYFIIHANAPISISDFDLPYSYHYSEPSTQAQASDYMGYLAIFIITIIAMSRVLFHNYIAAFGALSVTAITMSLTFASIQLLTGHKQIHLAMTLMVLSISVGHFLYFYYRWHVSQLKSDPIRSIEKSIDRNLLPALWTLPVLLISLGSLLFADSLIITTLSLSLMISSAYAYLINVTFLPAYLSYFVIKNPRVTFAKTCYGFANREIHYNPRLLQLFIALTLMVIIFIAIRFETAKEGIFDTHVDHQTITLKIPYEEVTLDTLRQLENFEDDLRHDNAGIAKVDSIKNVLYQLDIINDRTTPLDEQRVLQALFFLELYDLQKTYIDTNALNVTITLENADHSGVIRWLKEYKKMAVYFTDLDTLSESAKMDKRILLASSLFSALAMIGIIMGLIFKSFRIGLVGFAANAIPIIWFSLLMMLFNIELSIEVLIAMTISVGLTSDTIIHFAYKYFRSRYFGRTKKHALEIMFFYAGAPAIIGAGLLMIVFGLLSLIQLDTLVLIGAYGAMLMFMSLVTDLLILPVLLLAIDKQKDYHATLRA